MVLSIVESNGLRRFVMYRDLKVRFPSHKQLSHELIPWMLAKTMQNALCYPPLVLMQLFMLLLNCV